MNDQDFERKMHLESPNNFSSSSQEEESEADDMARCQSQVYQPQLFMSQKSSETRSFGKERHNSFRHNMPGIEQKQPVKKSKIIDMT